LLRIPPKSLFTISDYCHVETVLHPLPCLSWKAGRLVLDGESISLEDLAEILNKRLPNWIVHFGCCGTLSVKEFRIRNFISRTEALMVTGYKRDVDWLAGTVIDLLLLDQIQFYREMRRFWRRFNDTSYPFANLGLEAFHR